MSGKIKSQLLPYVFGIFLSVFLVGAAVPAAISESPLTRDEMTLRMIQFARAGRLTEARNVLTEYIGKNPTEGTMYYNRACLDLMLHEKEQAYVDLQLALENGYTNFRLIQADPDLDILRAEARFEELWTSFEEKFLVDFQARALYLDEGYLTENIELNLANPETAVSKMSAPVISVSFNKDELLVSVVVDDPHYTAVAPPWENGCGVLLNLIQPLSPDDYESRYYYSYGFHVSDGVAKATLVGKHGKILLHDAPGINPLITHKDGITRYDLSISWENFLPYGPPLDQEMGLNVMYFGAGEGNTRPIYSLMAEKMASYEADPWRRYVPISFLTSDRTVPLMQARLNNRLSQSDFLGVEIAHWSLTSGEAQFRFTFHPLDDPQRLMIEPILVKEWYEDELNFFNFDLDLTGLPEGSYTVRAELTNSQGKQFTGQYPFDNFEAGWLSSLNSRVHNLKTAEQSILKYHLFKLTSQVEKRLAQSNAFEFHAKYAAMVHMIEQCESGFSCMPERGLFQGGFTSDVMVQRRCAMYLPQGYRDMKDVHLIIVIPPSPGTENTLAMSLGKALEGKTDAVVLVPQSNGYSGLAANEAARHTVLAIEWAKELFHAENVTLVGLGTGSDAALETSLQRPDLCQEVLLDAEALYKDMVGFSDQQIEEAINSRTSKIPYTLVCGMSPSSRVTLLSESMSKQGLDTSITPLDTDGSISRWLPQWFLANQ